MRAVISASRVATVGSASRGFPEVVRDLFDPVARVADEKAVVSRMESCDNAVGQVPPLAEGAHLEVVGQHHRRPRKACRALDDGP